MHPRQLKPHPRLVRTGLEMVGAEAQRAIFVGDSTSDIEAGKRAGVPTIGYSSRPDKRERLTAACADAVIEHLDELTAALR